ncbi:MAG: metal ABC transporter ATP-binding protein [Clostridiales Family XIII bacterium]|jgi:zinc transport system ATP-binding protein|nr:metal ABC transporter ATP-binding protein [Clostridiales Family XIII bacterium]
MALIDCRDLSFAYDGAVAVSGLNFSVDSGDYICVAGENGSGKSTLLRGLLRLKQPHSGEMSVDAGLKPHEIGYLPQQSPAQKDFPAGVYEVVVSGRLGGRGLRPFYTRADKAAAHEAMELLGVRGLAKQCYMDLSGGQQQRVLLARAVCAAERVKLLALDEPSGGLDPAAQQSMYGLLSRLNGERGIAIVMVTHDVRGALAYASHVLHLQTRQLFFGTSREYADSELGRSFMG